MTSLALDPTTTASPIPDRCPSKEDEHDTIIDLRCIFDAGTHEVHLNSIGNAWTDDAAHVMGETPREVQR